jgi:iron complex transport system ATP-binding protein
MLQLMRDFSQQGGSMLIATHHIDEIIPEIDRVILLQQGQILADGPKEEVLTGANLSRLYGTPLEIGERNGWYRLWHE